MKDLKQYVKTFQKHFLSIYMELTIGVIRTLLMFPES